MNHPKAWLFVKLFGRNGARVFYVVLGVLIVVSAFFLCT
ncbi:MAG: Imm17 family immunity protein [Betaproteobacteria bacterium]|nr:Imm17 family immunity protein [Betaproteobacteria bacterium]